MRSICTRVRHARPSKLTLTCTSEPSKDDDGHPSATADHARPGGVPPPPSLPPAKRSCQSSSPTSGSVKVFFDGHFLPRESVLQGLRDAGVSIVNRPRDATYVVCEEPLRLSLTFTAASCIVHYAVTHEWVKATIIAGQPAEATNYVVDSHELEQEVGFNLADNLRRNREARDRSELRLLQDYAVCVDPNFQWPRDLLHDLQEMIDCSSYTGPVAAPSPCGPSHTLRFLTCALRLRQTACSPSSRSR